MAATVRLFLWKILIFILPEICTLLQVQNAPYVCCALDNHIQQGNELQIDQRRILVKRCLDMNDRALRNIVCSLGGKLNGIPREDHFIITVAREVAAILCLF